MLTRSSTSDNVPQASGSTGCDGWDPTKYILTTGTIAEHLSHDNGVQNFVCGAGTSNAPYWITNIIDTSVSGCNVVRGVCGDVTFNILPGIASLGGSGLEGSWGGLTRDDLVIRSVMLNTFQHPSIFLCPPRSIFPIYRKKSVGITR
jgi:hypothetical protein